MGVMGIGLPEIELNQTCREASLLALWCADRARRSFALMSAFFEFYCGQPRLLHSLPPSIGDPV